MACLASSNPERLIATLAGTCPKLRSLLHSPDLGPGFADEYEKVIEENIRRYQEAHGPAPEDAKVEVAV